MQHYRLARDVEIAVIDGQRRFGNGFCLPAGPLREPVSRLKRVNFAVVNNDSQTNCLAMHLAFGRVVNLLIAGQSKELHEFTSNKIHAVAGIGNPDRFFEQLIKAGLSIIKHPFVDHHDFIDQELEFNDGLPVIMTEKDAVKCQKFAKANFWFVSVEAIVDSRFKEQLLEKIRTFNG